jgi:3-polyprenyl-4-hydroxybenzoate decarboxylase
MEDGYLGEAIGRQFSPVLQFQHRDVKSVHLPLETGFHNLAIVASKQRYPRQGRKTALGLLGAGQMMFLKVIAAIDPEQNPKDLEAFLDALNDKVEISEDIVVLPGMVADALEAASPFENVHDKLLIDATSLVSTDPRSSDEPLEGSYNQPTPEWRQGTVVSEPFTGLSAVEAMPDVRQARMLRDNMLVVSTSIDGTPSPRTGEHGGNDGLEGQRIDKIIQLRNSIWQLDAEKNLRWLFITNDDLDMTHSKARRRLLWQLTSRFDVGRGLTFDDDRSRLCWDATTPIPSEEHGVRRWPAVTLHNEETLAKVAAHPELKKYEWPPHLSFGGPE